MKYTASFLYLAALVLAMASLPSLAQSPYIANAGTKFPVVSPSIDSGDPDSVLTIKKRVDEVNVLFIATDRHGKFVRNLNQGDFSILDDHKPPQSISNFRRDTDLPIELGLLLDTSGSVRSRFDFEEEAAISFLQHTLRPKFDRAFVMGFNGHSQIAQDFTDNVQLLEAGVHGLQNGGGTALYDAIYRASRDKLLKDKSDRPVRHAIVILSDGEDNQSDVSRAQAIEIEQRAEVLTYAISTDDSGLILRGDQVLQHLADATGGPPLFPFE